MIPVIPSQLKVKVKIGIPAQTLPVLIPILTSNPFIGFFLLLSVAYATTSSANSNTFTASATGHH
jgi:hypothetical protein